MNKNILFPGLAIMILLVTSCDKLNIFSPGSRQIRCVVGVSGTKALPITTAGAATNGTVSPLDIRSLGFTMEAYADEAYHDNETNVDYTAGKYFTKSVSCTKGSPDVWTINGDPKWLNDVNLRFFSWAPTTTSGTRTFVTTTYDPETPESTKLAFDYAYDATTVSGVSSCPSTNTEDLIFAYNSQKVAYDKYGNKTSGNEEVSIHFYHALSQIRFCLSTDDGTYDKSLKLVSIKLKDEPNGGSCVFDGAPASGDPMFDWDPSTTKVNFTQAFNAEFPGTGTPETIPTNWVKSSYTKDSTTYNLYTCTGDVLFLVPQASLAGKKLDLTFQKGTADPFTIEASIPSDGTDDKWEAGKYYTYKIKAVKIVSLTLVKQDWIDGGSDITL